MKHVIFFGMMSVFSLPLLATTDSTGELQSQMNRLQKQTVELQAQLKHLQKQVVKHSTAETKIKTKTKPLNKPIPTATPKLHSTQKLGHKFHQSSLSVHRPDVDPESIDFYPTALVADEHVVTYIAGTPVVTSPYLGSRPAFDGSDYIVNISSINRDIRLMQQRRRLYRAYNRIGYEAPEVPIIALSGKLEPVVWLGNPFTNNTSNGDITLGSSELDAAAILNKNVEAYLSFAYDAAPSFLAGQRVSNSAVRLNMGFVNIGNLDKTPFYFSVGQLYVPFGRFSSSMVSPPLTLLVARTKARPFIFGYKSQHKSGPFAAAYGYRSDAAIGSAAAGGLNLGYTFDNDVFSGELGASVISTIDDASGMQFTGSVPGTTFGGFASRSNGNEAVHSIPAAGVHGTINVDRYSFTAEWVSSTRPFVVQDLSFNGKGAMPQAGQLEAGVTFKTFDKPASFSLGYQWTKESLALNLPAQRIAGVYNISIWKDTVESLEYRHDIKYAQYQYANGAAPVGLFNANTISSGGTTDTVLAQIGVYF